MALPKISLPTFRVIVPSTKEEITMRPMTVKEEKILLMAKTNEDAPDSDILQSLVQVIGNCCVDKVNVANLSYFDIEWLFLKLREQSVSNIVKLSYQDSDTNENIDVEVDLTKVEIPSMKDVNDGVDLPGKIIMGLKYPSVSVYYSREYLDADEETRFNIILRNSINTIWQEDKSFDPKNSTKEELDSFIESIPSKQFEEINTFFANQPVMKHTIEYTNKRKEKKTIELRGLSDFFTF